MSTETLSIEEAMASGDIEAIGKALAAQNDAQDVSADGQAKIEAEEDTSAQADESKAETIAPEQEETEKVDAQAEKPSSGEQEDDVQKVILSKDGQHQIPYDVLESQREQNKLLREQIEQLRLQNSELEDKFQSNETLLENAKAQLEAQGMDTEDVFSSPDDITNKQWDALGQEYGELGKAMKVLFKNQSSIQNALNQNQKVISESSGNLVEKLINENTDLANWRDNDADRFEYAVSIDEKIKTQPEWVNRPMDERFKYVVSQVKQTFGDVKINTEQKAKQIINQVNNQPDLPPNSLSELGQTPVSKGVDVEQLKKMNADQVYHYVNRLSPQQVSEILDAGF